MRLDSKSNQDSVNLFHFWPQPLDLDLNNYFSFQHLSVQASMHSASWSCSEPIQAFDQ